MASYNTIKGLTVKYLSADPANPEDGQVWYNSTTGNLRVEGMVLAGSWASGGNMSTARYQLGGAGTQTAALAIGGSPNGSSSTSATEEYGGTAWTGGGSLPGAISYTAGCGTQTAGLQAGGANIPAYASTTTNEYDGSSWTGGGALNTATGSTGQIIGIQTAALITGGDIVPGVPRTIANVEEYNGTAWTAVTALPAVRQAQGTSGIQTAALVFGGLQDISPGTPNIMLSSTLEYDGSSWTAGGSLPATRKNLGGSGTQTASLGYGGNPGATPTNVNITLDYNGTAWSVNPATLVAGTQRAGYSTTAPSTAAIMFGGGNPSITAATEEYNGPSTQIKNITTS